MKIISVWVVVFMFFIGTTPVFAKDEGGKGPHPNEKAYEHANERARFKRTEDLKDKEAMKAAKKAGKKAEKERKRLEKETKKKQIGDKSKK